MKYTCSVCCGSFTADAVPKMCPYCGGKVKEIKTKARMTAEQTISDIIYCLPTAATARDQYVFVVSAIEDKMQLLRQYKRRGIVSAEEILDITKRIADIKTPLAAALKDYRAQKQNGTRAD